MHFSLVDSISNFFRGNGITILPEMELFLFALGVFAFDCLLEKSEKRWNGVLALVGIAASAFGLFLQIGRLSVLQETRSDLPGLLGFRNAVVVDGFFLVFAGMLLAGTALVILLSLGHSEDSEEKRGGYYAMLLLSCVGMMLMASGSDLRVMLAGLELTAVSLAALAALSGRPGNKLEIGIKSFLPGAMGTVFVSGGFFMLYRIAASSGIWEIGNILDRRYEASVSRGAVDWMVAGAAGAIAAGLLVKLAGIVWSWRPSRWAPGAGGPVGVFVYCVVVTGWFGLLIRIFVGVFGGSQPAWKYFPAGIAIAALLWGNMAALFQKNTVRALLYLCGGQAGCILLGLVGANESGLTGAICALVAYIFPTIGAFAAITLFEPPNSFSEASGSVDGLFRRSPTAAMLLGVFLLSLAGIPGTAGFRGKSLIFRSLMESQHRMLAIFTLLSILPGVYCYFRIIARMFRSKTGELPALNVSSSEAVVLGVALFVSLVAGMYSGPFTRLAHYAFGP